MGRTLLRNAVVYDGSGADGAAADVLIEDDAVRDVAPGIAVEPGAAEEVDCTGCAVAPGFIDIHGHSDFFILAYPKAESRVMAGVTTEVAGNCGGSPFPVGGELSERRNLQLRGVWAMFAGETGIDWTDAQGYFDRWAVSGSSMNIAFLVGHGNLHALTVGYSDAAPTPEQLGRMERLLAEGLEAGAYGLSTGLIYPPGCYASTDEIVRLARVVGRQGGIYASHIRGESHSLVEAVDECLTIVERSGCRGIISHLKTMGRPNWPKLDRVIEHIESARSRGAYVVADRYPYLAAMTGLDSILFPDWVVEGGLDAELGRLSDPAMRTRLREALETLHPEPDWPDRVRLSSCGTAANATLAGLTLRQLADRWDADPLEAALRLLVEERTCVTAVHFCMSDDNLQRLYRLPYVMVASDSSVRGLSTEGNSRPHPRGFGTPARFLGHYVRDEGLMSWGEGIRRLTGLPAEVMGWRRRGRLAAGTLADVVVFRPDELADRATYDEPIASPAGIRHVLVAGRFVVRDGRHTGDTPGRILRRGEPE